MWNRGQGARLCFLATRCPSRDIHWNKDVHGLCSQEKQDIQGCPSPVHCIQCWGEYGGVFVAHVGWA